MKNFRIFMLLGGFVTFLPLIIHSQINFGDITFWAGNGQFKSALVVDFNDNSNPECYVWGYRFDDTTNVTALQMFQDIDSLDAALSFVIQGGFLVSAYYKNHQAVGGTNNYYFATFNSYKVFGNWTMNMGLSEILKDSLWFGASFTLWDDSTFLPVYVPENPVPASNPTHLTSFRKPNPYIYPNPLKDIGIFTEIAERIEVFTLDGRKVSVIYPDNHLIKVSSLENGWYIFRWEIDANVRSELIMVNR